MKGLIAKRPILYRGRMYRDGENLPGDDTQNGGRVAGK